MPADDEAAAVLERELIAFCREELADVKCPRSIDFREELPRHPTGKLYKRLLQKEEYERMGYDFDQRLAGKRVQADGSSDTSTP
jgi:acyl-coenzyme A synthetase/AMP-(fatty) acid ligase